MHVVVGQKATVTSEMVRSFAEMTGDCNPLHFDEEFAARTRFGRLIAQGAVTTGILNALVAMDMPGPGTVFVKQTWRYPAPVYIGDSIRAEASVKRVHEGRPMADMDVVITNQHGEEVLLGEATVYQAAPTENPGGAEG